MSTFDEKLKEPQDVTVIQEVGGQEETPDMLPQNHLQRTLKPRHIQMIAIGGVIGTGLFLGTASNLQSGGPAGLLIAYCLMSSILFAVMTSLGEMVSHLPLPGGHVTLAGRFVSREMGFALGWLWWLDYIVVLPAEVSACAVLISYWTPKGTGDGTCTTGICNNAMWVGLVLIVVWAINFGGTKYYGECEFWFASIKVITIIGLIITGIVITSGGGPNHETIGFRFWNETGGFMQYDGIAGAKGRFLGFFSTLISAAFAFIGSEATAVAAAETSDPRRAVPRAIKSVWIRLVLFYITSAFIIGLLVSPSDPSLSLGSTAAKSPFVIAMKNAGIKVLPSIINAALLTSAWSAAVADLYISSRSLYAITLRGDSPRWFGPALLKTRKDGLPWVCVCVCAAFSLLSFMAADSGGSAGTVFGYFSDMTAYCGVISWSCVLFTGIRWSKGLKLGLIDRNSLPYKAPLQPYLSYYALAICFIVIVFGGFTNFMEGFNTSGFITTYFPVPFFFVLMFGYKLIHKTKMVRYEDMDFYSGCSEDVPVDEEAADSGIWEKIKWSI
ncbi:hypothetical protein, variant [Cryptococcus amylolentus CBS 6039]|uniref:Amino acid permease/ SLC12A domain-containing protein n=1 Tax=Cryptococcus amylolentus CBS 6039 TaxID=1295533 RepID=A0A1E3HR82_9TREE|nr:hypothetical protein, variant [Cryptococcus amylolentus CBS 6039]ODN78873.1 hypothetical protein, variant [Cryptococcus amylolentus CBS 6039]